jgi:hypothetical protein
MTGINFIPVRREKTFRNLIPVKAAKIGRRQCMTVDSRHVERAVNPAGSTVLNETSSKCFP